jgi:uncharacterized protein YbjQ (UPF0145 family)
MATGQRAWREVSLVAAVMIVVALIVAVGLVAVVGVTVSSIRGAEGSKQTAQQTAASTGDVSGTSTKTSEVKTADVRPQDASIELIPTAKAVTANAILRLTVRYQDHQDPQDLHVQLRRHRRWVTFPLPAVASGSDRFKAFVELGHRGPNRLRMIDRSTGRVSNVATVTVR